MGSSSGKGWWRRASAAVKDRCSLYLAKSDLEVALIKASSHDPSSIDYKNVGRVFAWAKTSPSTSLPLLLPLLSRRLHRTRTWVVALKGLLVAHGLLLCSPALPRLPFDLSLFLDRSSSPAFSAFVRAYFNFLAHRSRPPTNDNSDQDLARLQRMQDLLDLLMQIRPYGDDMVVPLVLEAMDCVVVEVFDVYSGICNGIAHALVSIFGSPSFWKEGAEARKGLLGIRVLRRAREQSAKLSRYLEVCRGLGVLNASDLPALQSVPEEDIEELERLVMGEGDGGDEMGEEEERVIGDGCLKTVVTKDWVVFDSEQQSCSSRMSRNPFLCSGTPWELQPVYSHHSLCHQQLHGRDGWDNRDLLAL